jgi:hypothetical protein
MVMGGQLHTPTSLPGTNYIEAEWASGLIWTGAENLALVGIRSPNRPARNKSLYRLRYSGPPDLRKSSPYQISWKSIQWGPLSCMRIDGRTDSQTDRRVDMIKVTSTFREYEKTPKYVVFFK